MFGDRLCIFFNVVNVIGWFWLFGFDCWLYDGVDGFGFYYCEIDCNVGFMMFGILEDFGWYYGIYWFDDCLVFVLIFCYVDLDVCIVVIYFWNGDVYLIYGNEYDYFCGFDG